MQEKDHSLGGAFRGHLKRGVIKTFPLLLDGPLNCRLFPKVLGFYDGCGDAVRLLTQARAEQRNIGIRKNRILLKRQNHPT